MPIDPDYNIVSKKSEGFFINDLVPQGVYTVKIADINLKLQEQTSWGLKDNLYFTFEISDGRYVGKRLTKRTSASFVAQIGTRNPSALYSLACAVEGKILDDANPFNPNSLMSKKVQAIVKHVAGKKPGQVFANISDFLPITQSGQPTEEEMMFTGGNPEYDGEVN